MLKVPVKGAGYIAPLKPTLVDEPPAGDGRLHELKHDGYRISEGQVETAAGNAGEGTNKRNYRRLRPGYLAELIAGIEEFWRSVDRFSDVHLRTQCGPKVVSMAAARAGLRMESL